MVNTMHVILVGGCGPDSGNNGGVFTGDQPPLDILVLTEEQKDTLKSSWQIVYSHMGQHLSYVGTSQGSASMEQHKTVTGTDSSGVADTFLRLFEEYPQSQEFFATFRGTDVTSLREDKRLSQALQEHAVRVMQVVEKVIGRIESLDKVSFLLEINFPTLRYR